MRGLYIGFCGLFIVVTMSVRYNLRLSKDLYQRLKEISQKNHVSIARIIRAILNYYLYQDKTVLITIDKGVVLK